VWCDNPPFASKNLALKEETYFKIIEALAKLSTADLDKINSSDLDQRKSTTLAKYVLKAFEMLANQDASKFEPNQKETSNLINSQQLLKIQLKVTERCGPGAILKAGFERNPVIS
jgi:hypothetical protein